MSRYLKIHNELYEVDYEGYCLRSIEINDKLLKSSNFPTDDYFLPEGKFVLEEIDAKVEIISKQKFNSHWKLMLNSYLNKWLMIKKNMELGNKINCKLNCITPQGALFETTMRFFALMSYDEALNSIGSKNMYPGTEAEFTITGYDDNQLWFLIKQ